MADLTDYGENRLIKALLDELPLGAGTNVHAIGLFKATTNNTDTQTEVYSTATNGYARILVSTLFTDTAATGETDSNNVVATWTNSHGSASWPEVTHVGLCATDTENAADVIAVKAITATTVTAGSTISFATTTLAFTAV